MLRTNSPYILRAIPAARMRSLLGLSVVLLGGCAGSHAQAGAGPQRPPTPVLATTVSRQSIASTTTLDGQVVPYLQANVATQSSGTVLAVYANLGDHVRAGDVLAKIDDSPLQAQLAQQAGTQSEAAAKLSQAQIQEPITTQSAAGTYQQAQESLAQAKKQLLADQAAVHQNELTSKADQKLLAQGFVSTTAEAQARSAYIASQQVLGIDQIRVMQAESVVRTADRNRLTGKLQQQVIAEGQGAVAQAQGSAQLLRTQIRQATLTAPFDAVVTQRMLDPGAYAGPSQPIFALAQLNPAYVTFNVKDTDLPYVHPGSAVTFTASAVPKRVFHGRVSVINVVPTVGTLLYPARLTVANPDEALRGGMLVNVSFQREHAANVLTVPTLGVSQEANGAAVYAIVKQGDQTIAKRMPVTVGITAADRMQISGAGIHDGLQIIAARPDTLQDNAPVAVSAKP